MTEYYDLNEFKAAVLRNLQENEVCTCDTPCCEVDIGVGVLNCGAQHCGRHGTPENQGIPSYSPYGETFYVRDHIGGIPIAEHTYEENRARD